MLKLINNTLVKKFLKRYEKGPWPMIIDISLLCLIIIAALYGFNRFKKQTQVVFLPSNQQISSAINAKNIDLTKSMIEVNFAWKNALINRDTNEDYLFLNLKNTAQYNIRDLKISFVAPAGSNIQKGGESIYIGALAQGEEKNLEHLIKIETDKKTLNLGLKAIIEYEVFGKRVQAEIEVPNLKIEAFIESSAFALYTTEEGDQLGLGPLPPVVDEPTNYWVFFDIMSLGNISDFTLKAKLSEETEFLNNYSLLAGNLTYDEEKKEINWHIPGIVSGADKYRLGIEIMFLPTEEQVDTSPVLVNNIKYFAIDENTHLDISGKLKDISTNIERDLFNPGNGKVTNPGL